MRITTNEQLRGVELQFQFITISYFDVTIIDWLILLLLSLFCSFQKHVNYEYYENALLLVDVLHACPFALCLAVRPLDTTAQEHSMLSYARFW